MLIDSVNTSLNTFMYSFVVVRMLHCLHVSVLFARVVALTRAYHARLCVLFHVRAAWRRGPDDIRLPLDDVRLPLNDSRLPLVYLVYSLALINFLFDCRSVN